ncbi:MAG TPA: hypothetical protein VGP07_15460 [Polyangia bacterium]|jgi:hypothetical protein
MMTDAALRRRLAISNSGLGVGLTLLGFSLYTIATAFGRGHGTTILRGLVALPLGLVIVYLSFSWVCSTCGATLRRSVVDTTPARASEVARALLEGGRAAAAQAWEAARGQRGAARISVQACPQCRRLARLRFRGVDAKVDGVRLVTGEAATLFIDAPLSS